MLILGVQPGGSAHTKKQLVERFDLPGVLRFPLVAVLKLVQSDLQLLLDLVEVVHLLLGLGQLLARLGLTLL